MEICISSSRLFDVNFQLIRRDVSTSGLPLKNMEVLYSCVNIFASPREYSPHPGIVFPMRSKVWGLQNRVTGTAALSGTVDIRSAVESQPAQLNVYGVPLTTVRPGFASRFRRCDGYALPKIPNKTAAQSFRGFRKQVGRWHWMMNHLGTCYCQKLFSTELIVSWPFGWLEAIFTKALDELRSRLSIFYRQLCSVVGEKHHYSILHGAASFRFIWYFTWNGYSIRHFLTGYW